MGDIVTGFRISDPQTYALIFSDRIQDLSSLAGSQVRISHNGELACCYCSRAVKKLYQNGYCYPCTRTLARCDLCILKPELCHFHLGTCREPDWGDSHCMQPHIVYISWTSSFKVGLTRKERLRTRWREQGAMGGVALVETSSRLQAGLIESALAKQMPDKTNWRLMLAMRDNGQAHWDEHGAHLREQCVNVIDGLAEDEGIRILDESWQTLDGQYTGSVKAHSLPITANKLFTSQLLGFKGHYMIFPEGVINIRKLVGHQLDISAC